MSFDLAIRLVNFSKALNANNIFLIGGEPTYYPHIFKLIKYIRDQGMQINLATNGYKFKDMDFVKKAVDSGLNTITFSLKAANAEQQKKLTKIDVFADIKQAIKNLSAVKTINVIYSTVISNDTIDNMEEFAQLVADTDNKKYLTYTMCNPVFDATGDVNKKYVPEPSELVKALVKKYDKINQILDNKILIEQNLPVCFWPKEFIKKLKEKKQLCFGCHIRTRNGLIFDKGGEIIVCNSLPAFPIGKYGIDFTNKEEFEKFWMNKELIGLYNKIHEYPSTKCQLCKDYLECWGGCPLRWFAYDAKEILGE